jgi:hypothetical protein
MADFIGAMASTKAAPQHVRLQRVIYSSPDEVVL